MMKQQSLLKEMNKLGGKKVDGEQRNTIPIDGSFSSERPAGEPMKPPVRGSIQDGWDEYRVSVKKVELPGFQRTDPMVWIQCA